MDISQSTVGIYLILCIDMGYAIVIEVDVYLFAQSSDLYFPIVLRAIPENKTEKGC